MAVTLGQTQISGISIPVGDISGNVVTTQYLDANGTKPNITYISRCGHNSLFILADGILYSTAATAGSFGNATTGRGLSGTQPQNGLESLKQVPIPTTYPIVQVGAGYHCFAFALDSAGNLFTWGTNSSGQCGNGTVAAIPTPILVATGVVKVYDDPSNGSFDVTNSRLFILKTDGYVYGTGYNGYGALGIGSTTNASVFTRIKQVGGVDFAANSIVSLWNLGSIYGMTMLQTTDGHIWVAGYNGYGQLGIGSVTSATYFTDTSGAWNGGDYTMVIRKVGGTWGWYDNVTVTAYGTTIVWASNPSGVHSIRSSGFNAWGSIGNNTVTQQNSPVAITVGTGLIADMATFGGGPCSVHVLLTNGALYAWGYNGLGQLGVNDTVQRNLPTVVFASGIRRLLHHGFNGYSQPHYALAFIEDTSGIIYASGYNGCGQLGVGDATQRNVFTKCLISDCAPKVPDSIKFLGQTMSQPAQTAMFAVTSDNTIYGWGVNNQYSITRQSTNHVYAPLHFTLEKGERRY